jgi:hypothetical protein
MRISEGTRTSKKIKDTSREEVIHDTQFIENNSKINYYCQCQGDSCERKMIEYAENKDRCRSEQEFFQEKSHIAVFQI